MIYVQLFYEFFLIGLFSIGGGLATLPFLEELGIRRGWFSTQLLADMLAVSESTPGPIGVNMATYTGYTTAGSLGGVVATIGIISPSIIIILIIANLLVKFTDNKYVNSAFNGLRPASAGLVSAACISTLAVSLFMPNAKNTSITLIVIFIAVLLVYFCFKTSLKFSKSVTKASAFSAILSVAILATYFIFTGKLDLPSGMSPINIIVFFIFFALNRKFKKLHPIVLISISAILGIVLKL